MGVTSKYEITKAEVQRLALEWQKSKHVVVTDIEDWFAIRSVQYALHRNPSAWDRLNLTHCPTH